MSMLFAYMTGGKWGGGGLRVFKMFCQRRSDFFLLVLCVCWGGEEAVFSTSPSYNRKFDSLRPTIHYQIINSLVFLFPS